MTESLTKEERIQLSTRWPPDTKLFLKLLRVHDELVDELDKALKGEADAVCALDSNWVQHQRIAAAEARVAELQTELSAYKDTVMTLDSYRLKLENQ
jgi:hypothetical protein